jgi:LPXTG-site transpeptidase (sortase) family protein
MNFDAIYKIFKQNRNPVSAQDQTNELIAQKAISLPSVTATPYYPSVVISATKTPILPTPSATSSIKSETASAFKNDWLYYPKLSIQAPVEWYVKSAGDANKLMATSLVHMKGTATPEIPGEAVIAGHSSYYKWVAGNYKSVFAPLVKAQNGDNIIIKRNGISYFYTVSNIHEIPGSSDYAAKVGGNNQKSVTLLTCVPVGTTLRRLIITANLVRQI